MSSVLTSPASISKSPNRKRVLISSLPPPASRAQRALPYRVRQLDEFTGDIRPGYGAETRITQSYITESSLLLPLLRDGVRQPQVLSQAGHHRFMTKKSFAEKIDCPLVLVTLPRCLSSS